MYLKADFGFTPRVLIVEDDPVTREVIASDLSAEAIDVDVCDTVARAESLLANDYDIVLLDLGLPDRSGKEVMNAINAREHLHSAVICLTASSASEDILEMYEQGAMDYIIKPFDRLALRAKIATLLRIRQQSLALARANAELKSALRVAEEARLAESKFMANMSHEIRNPLNGVVGLINAALTETDPKQQKEELTVALSACDQLRHIVDDILELKKMDAGEYVLKSESFDYHDVRKNLIEPIRYTANVKNITLDVQTDLQAVPRFLIGDAVRVTQIGANIFSNAIKFTPEGGTIVVKASYDHAANVFSLMCKDSGIGMSPETVATIFERFRQASDGTTKHYEGTGLGLAIAHKLATAMGGTIEVESKPGEGSTFTAVLPLPVDQERESRYQEERTAGAINVASVTPALTGVKLLCVDDSRINLKVISNPLIKAGASVVLAESAAEALAIIESEDFDIIFTDITMPETDGEELQRQISALKPSIPVVAVTGNVLEDDVRRYLDNGFAAALGKPLDIEKLFQVIDLLVQRS